MVLPFHRTVKSRFDDLPDQFGWTSGCFYGFAFWGLGFFNRFGSRIPSGLLLALTSYFFCCVVQRCKRQRQESQKPRLSGRASMRVASVIAPQVTVPTAFCGEPIA